MLLEAMRPLVARSPVFYAGSPVMLDVGAVSADGSPHYRPLTKPQLSGLVGVFQDLDLSVLGVTNGSPDICELALGLGLPHVASSGVHFGQRDSVLESAAPQTQQQQQQQQQQQTHRASTKAPTAKARDAEVPVPVASPAPPAPAAQPPRASEDSKEANNGASVAVAQADDTTVTVNSPPTTTFIGTHVRSGQRVYAPGSLVVVGNVGSGAEIVAEGDIHVYGTLKGRAVAGLSGDRDAKIFVSNVDAELLSIADVYMTCDTPESIPPQVRAPRIAHRPHARA